MQKILVILKSHTFNLSHMKKNILVNCHPIRVENETFHFPCPTNLQFADIFTECITRDKHHVLLTNLLNNPHQFEG